MAIDYTARPLWFKVLKAGRYARLYGLRRTWNIVKGQYHVKRSYDPLPETGNHSLPGQHVGILGCGNFSYGVIAYYLRKNYGNVIRGAMDIDANRAASLCGEYKAGYYTTDANRVLDDPAIDIVYIASNNASHAEYAIQALARGKAVHIEKPHVVNENQLARLCEAMVRTGGKVRLGFNRPRSHHGRMIKDLLAAQDGPSMMSWFFTGGRLPSDHWFFKPEEGGRILGNVCHWTDFILQMVPVEKRFPITIHPLRIDRVDEDVAINLVFGDGTIGTIHFSTKGETFEGEKEKFNAHRGDLIITLEDFSRMVVEVKWRRRVIKPFFRDHGHDLNMRESYEMSRPGGLANTDSSVDYIWETGMLFLNCKEALEQSKVLTMHGYRATRAPHPETRAVIAPSQASVV